MPGYVPGYPLTVLYVQTVNAVHIHYQAADDDNVDNLSPGLRLTLDWQICFGSSEAQPLSPNLKAADIEPMVEYLQQHLGQDPQSGEPLNFA